MEQEAIDLLIRKKPRLKSARAKLEAMKTGAYCIHRAWGLGQITGYNAATNRLQIDFEDKEGIHEMDPAFCVDKLDILEDHNILVRQKNDPKAIESLIKDRPNELIQEILSHYPDNAATASELEKQISRLFKDKSFKKWWTATKKTLVKDPKIAVPTRKTDPYILREEEVKAEDEVLEEFFETKSPKKKVSHASKLLDLSVKHEDIKETLPDILEELAVSLRETKMLNRGERLNGIWIRNDLARFIHADPESLDPTSADLLRESGDLSDLAELIPATKYKRYLDLIKRTFLEDWQKISFDLLRNSSGKFTNECVHFLHENELGDQLRETFQRWLSEHNLKGPILLWIVKNRNSRKYRHLVQGLVGPRLLNAIFYAIDYEALQTAGSRRIALADALSDDPELIVDLLADATPETAHDLATTLMLNQGFEDLSKKSLLARFIRLFPSIQSIVVSDTQQTDQGLIVSEKSFEDRKREYDDLINNKIPANKEAIAQARELGDLKENSEYKMARQDQDTLLARKNHLETDLARAKTTDFSDAPVDTVGIGSTVELLQGSTNTSVTYAILGAWDSNPENNVLSYQTPLGQSLLGKAPGQTVKIEVEGHEEEWTVRKIDRWLDHKPTVSAS